MTRVFIIGTGNLGRQLITRFQQAMKTDIELVGYRNLSGEKLPTVSAPLSMESIPTCDLIILAVPDDRISSISDSLDNPNVTIAHTSGSVSIAALNRHERRGVLYIPQTFSKHRSVDLSQVTICLEASNDNVMKQLEMVSVTLSRKLTHINSHQRKKLHLAAVYMNNFVNHCYTKAAEIAQESAIDQELLYPLMEETMLKAQELGASNAQSGPAMRGDKDTIARQLEQLPEEDRAMYEAITQSIKHTHG
ncbi:Rossmann-like and DUF2520 domain-containing protein [Nonlabens ponticola]|nr:Rossmann-like and DUF2520 domain-containing protein [Nonlabens ponticola]